MVWQIKMQLKIAQLLTAGSSFLSPLLSMELATAIISRARVALDALEESKCFR